MQTENWSQGNWNAWVVQTPDKAESVKRCRNTPLPFREAAINHAKTYWSLRPRDAGFAGMSKSCQRWPLLEMTPADLKWGDQQLRKVRAAGKTAPDRDFGDLRAGFAAEKVIDRWLTEKGIDHVWNNDPIDPQQDYEFGSLLVDLKTHVSLGGPKPEYTVQLSEEQRQGSSARDWYMFAKLDSSNMTDLWLLGFQTEAVIMSEGQFYRKGEIRKKMTVYFDCWCLEYQALVEPADWLAKI